MSNMSESEIAAWQEVLDIQSLARGILSSNIGYAMLLASMAGMDYKRTQELASSLLFKDEKKQIIEMLENQIRLLKE